MLRNHGAAISEEQRHQGPRPYLLPAFNLMGFNYRMTDLQGAIGLTQLSHLDEFVNERAVMAARYRAELADIDWLTLPEEPGNGRHAWQAFVTYVDPDRAPMARNAIMDKLRQSGVATRPGTHAVHMLRYYANLLGVKPDDFPGARDCDTNSMAIPLHNRMDEDDLNYVIEALHDIA
jgi:dTDP-4-amino-4,6-dideoxygalactose transaminase